VPLHPLVNIGVRAARRAGDIIFRSLNRLESLEVSSKGRNDYVTEVDRHAEADIIATIQRTHPDHGFLGEESGLTKGASEEFVWIIDPLDGTTNFMHGLPQFCVSIAVQYRGRIEHAVVYDPMRQELFTASHGGGAQLDDKRIRVSKSRGLEDALISTGFPYRDNNIEWLDAYLAMFKAVTLNTAGIRRPGSAALDLAWLAAGRTDAFWEMGLGPWDTAAGSLLVTEAGGRISTLSGDEYGLGGDLIAGSPKTYEELLALLAPHIPADLRSAR
jgi:myo-inositol-1(or 4)-monophosphatase